MENGKQCCRCRYFDRYYVKGTKRFSQIKFGWCSIKLQHVSSGGCCEEHISKSYNPRSNKVIRHCLNDMLTELSTIRQMIEEENE